MDPKDSVIMRLTCTLNYALSLVICYALVMRGGGIAVEMSGALTKVLPRQCGGNIRGLLYIGKKGREMKR